MTEAILKSLKPKQRSKLKVKTRFGSMTIDAIDLIAAKTLAIKLSNATVNSIEHMYLTYIDLQFVNGSSPIGRKRQGFKSESQQTRDLTADEIRSLANDLYQWSICALEGLEDAPQGVKILLASTKELEND